MPEAQTLIPVFSPPLANMLAFAEQKRERPLTAAEVEAIRDHSACIMMESVAAQEMARSRGFIDINPENCWADWHRLRVQMTGNGYLPKIVLCIPGGDDLRERCESILEAENIDHEFRGHDDMMVRAFRASSIPWPCFGPKDYGLIEAHKTVLYVLSKNFVAAEAPAIGRVFVKLGRRLLDAGGIAIKCESSGISHSRERWSGFDDSADRSPDDTWRALLRAYAAYPIGTNSEMYTCGLHLLGVPDLIISEPAIARPTTTEASVAAATAELFRIFATYLVAECPVGEFASGHTFSVDRESPRYRMVWEPCVGFDQDSFFFNPFGRWRFTTY